MTIRDYTFLMTREYSEGKRAILAFHKAVTLEGTMLTDTELEAAWRDARPASGDVWDYFTLEPGRVGLRLDWLKNLEARCTSVIPPERRFAFRMLRKAVKYLERLDGILAGSVTLDNMLEAANDKEKFNRLPFMS